MWYESITTLCLLLISRLADMQSRHIHTSRSSTMTLTITIRSPIGPTLYQCGVVLTGTTLLFGSQRPALFNYSAPTLNYTWVQLVGKRKREGERKGGEGCPLPIGESGSGSGGREKGKERS